MQILSDTDVIVAICPKSVLDSGDRKHPASAGEQAKQRSTCSFAEVFQDVRCHFTRSLTNLMKMGEVEATTFCQRLASSWAICIILGGFRKDTAKHAALQQTIAGILRALPYRV